MEPITIKMKPQQCVCLTSTASLWIINYRLKSCLGKYRMLSRKGRLLHYLSFLQVILYSHIWYFRYILFHLPRYICTWNWKSCFGWYYYSYIFDFTIFSTIYANKNTWHWINAKYWNFVLSKSDNRWKWNILR